jgi:FkbM family methyltransferase
MNILKGLLKGLLRCFRKANLWLVLLWRLMSSRSEYEFSLNDIRLFVREKFVILRGVSARTVEEEGLLEVTVGEHRVFWPSELPVDDLPWLHHEVFDDFSINPSSYAHPRLGYEGRKWIIDAGAAEGYFSIFALQQSAALIICVEPLFAMRHALIRSLDANGGKGRSTVVSVALSDRKGCAEFLLDPRHVCDSKMRPMAASHEGLPVVDDVQRVQVTTLDLLAEEFSLKGGGLIKMDIEGFEMAALTGGGEVLRKHKPALAIAVYHDLENAKKCAAIILAANPSYEIEFRGYYGYFSPARPYMVFAF